MAASGALFGSAAARSPWTVYLVDFRAGKMFMRSDMVHPDKRKGLLYLYRSEDSLIHFCWRDRTSGTVEDDLIIFPDDCEFKPLKQCKSGRVFLLKFKTHNRKLFFGMQEPKGDKDEDYCKKMNDYMNNPPIPGRGGGGGGASGTSGIPHLSGMIGQEELQNILGGMSQEQLIQLLGASGVSGLGGLGNLLGAGALPNPALTHVTRNSNQSTTSARARHSSPTTTTTTSSTSTTTTASTPTTSSTPPVVTPTTAVAGRTSTSTTDSVAQGQGAIQLSDLQTILSGMKIPAAGESLPSLDLSQALTSDLLLPILQNREFQEQLRHHLPQELQGNTDELLASTNSPQFQQSLGLFSAALQSGQLGALMAQFGYTGDVVKAADAGDMDNFLKALQKAQEKKGEGKDGKKEEESSKKDDEADDDGMALD